MRRTIAIALCLTLPWGPCPQWARAGGSKTVSELTKMVREGKGGRESVLEIIREEPGLSHFAGLSQDQIARETRVAASVFLPRLGEYMAIEHDALAKARAQKLAKEVFRYDAFAYNLSLEIMRVVAIRGDASQRRRILYLAGALDGIWREWVHTKSQVVGARILMGSLAVGVVLWKLGPRGQAILRAALKPLFAPAVFLEKHLGPGTQAIGWTGLLLIPGTWAASIKLTEFFLMKVVRRSPGHILFQDKAAEVQRLLATGQGVSIEIWPTYESRGKPDEEPDSGTLSYGDLIKMPVKETR